MNKLIETTGVPMRMLDRRGTLESEITKIKSGVKLPADYYTYPQGFQVTDMQHQMQHFRDNMPDMNQLMQQSGTQQGMPPDMQERLRKMQERLKQQFQQQ
jgi:hypothetical protein